jgi:hypothetical protein
VTTVPFTCTRPEEINSSAFRREATPAAAIIFWSRSSGIMKSENLRYKVQAHPAMLDSKPRRGETI